MGLVLDEPNKGEEPVKVNGVDVLVSEDVKTFAERSKIDYVEGPYRQGFTVGLAGGHSC